MAELWGYIMELQMIMCFKYNEDLSMISWWNGNVYLCGNNICLVEIIMGELYTNK